MTILFRIFTRWLLNYSLKFHSRIFVDIVNVAELFYDRIISLVSSSLSSTSSRSLYEQQQQPSWLSSWWVSDGRKARALSESSINIDYLHAKVFHSINQYSDFFFSAFFYVLLLVFFLAYWEFYDFTDRTEVRPLISSTVM